MKRHITLITLSLWAMALIAQALPSTQLERPQSVGLVLSGGGARGIAHIGLIQALEDNDIPIDYITGTSMGSIVGGLYACGFSPAEMMDIITSKSFAYWSTGQIDENLIYYFLEEPPTPALARLNLAKSDSTSQSSTIVLPSSLISPLPMNFGFFEIFTPYTAQCGGDFNKLFVPFRCIVSDVTHKHKIVCKDGPVGEAIRESMNFPIVFHPIERNGAMLYDGGIYENYPIETMRRVFAPDFMIGSNVSSGSEKPSPNESIMDQLETMIIQHNRAHMPDSLGINLRMPVERFGLLDFTVAKEIYQVGYDYAMTYIDSIKGRVTSRRSPEVVKLRRKVFKSNTPPIRIDSVIVTGGTPSQNKYLADMFKPRKGCDTIGVSEVRDAYYRAITPGKLRNFVPSTTYNDTTGLFTLKLRATVKNHFDVGVGGYVSSSTSSMLFFSGAYRTLSFHSFDAHLNGWIGQSYMAALLDASVSLTSSHPSALKVEVVGSRHKFYQSDKFFFEHDNPTFVSTDELFGRLSVGTSLTRTSKAQLSFGAGHIVHRYFRNLGQEVITDRRDHSSDNLLQLAVRIDRSTLDNIQYPTQGAAYHLTLMGVAGRMKYPVNNYGNGTIGISQWHNFGQLEFTSSNYWNVGRKFSFGLESDIMLSTRRLLKSYYASVIEAPAFNPTPSSYTIFDPAFRANNWVAVGIVPVWKISSILQARATAYGFVPIHRIIPGENDTALKGKLFRSPEFFGELACVANLPFASLSAYGRYTSSQRGGWNVGISFGVFLLAPKFLR